ncbi:MAG: nucleoside deaminase [Phycisphaerae bacterium]|nr:nucleoside deaminase [Phycisphaerae bacterium]
MLRAIEVTRTGIADGQTPFGAVIVKNERIIAEAHNNVWNQTDPTAHAEVCAIRQACRKLDTIDLGDCVIYSTTEPCPMCFAAIHWAKISRIVFGATIVDAHAAGFNELHISNEQMKSIGRSKVDVVGNFMRQPCVELFTEWLDSGKSKVY